MACVSGDRSPVTPLLLASVYPSVNGWVEVVVGEVNRKPGIICSASAFWSVQRGGVWGGVSGQRQLQGSAEGAGLRGRGVALQKRG